MFKWKRLGQVFVPDKYNTPLWMQEFAQSPSAILYKGLIRIYFCTRPKPNDKKSYVSYIGYLDVTKDDPTKIVNISPEPLIDLGGVGTFDEFGTNPVSAIKLNEDEVNLYYAGWTRCESVPINGAIGIVASTDGGNSFERLGAGPVIPYSLHEPFMMGSPRVKIFNGVWYLFYVAGKVWIESDSNKLEPIYKIRAASSNDGINWNKFNTDLIVDKIGELECQACPDVSFFDGKFHMFFSYRNHTEYKNSKGGYRIGYASSSNLFNWERDDSIANFDVSAVSDDWDSQMVSYPNILQLDNRVLMFYQGNQMGLRGFGVCELVRKK
ncbi:hypothetical protein [uncultured Psychrosphaera sp.]|uniref:hypothetical protein n=1 Tax=uncultured Psychrosphaera sp. TaxID=1403522 RepID=UPI00260E5870|nr:hypothetical protein [uncultured Psychrosphaera sp.]